MGKKGWKKIAAQLLASMAEAGIAGAATGEAAIPIAVAAALAEAPRTRSKNHLSLSREALLCDRANPRRPMTPISNRSAKPKDSPKTVE